MTYYDIVESLINGKNINDLPLRVSYYARVSTDSDVQLNSLSNQLSYYEKYIKSNNNWLFIKGYVDEGISGVRAVKRPSFMKMINDARMGKFDLIITKDVSRFARDIEDSVHYTRMLKDYGVGVLFENQSLSTYDANSELTLNILYNLSQEESKKISNSVKFGFKKAINNGRVLGSSNITGYKKDNCKLIIDKEEARFVKRVFELYSTGKYGFYKLSKILLEDGHLNKKGKPYDKDTLKRIIKNPKYKGYYRSRTYEIIDYRTKKRKKNDINDQIIYKANEGIIPSIVSEELWNKANQVLSTRTDAYKNNNYWSGGVKYAFSSKIFCKEHNASYQRSQGNRKRNRPTWSCSLYIQHGIEFCISPIIIESDLIDIMFDIMNKVLLEKESIVDNLIKLYDNVDNNKSLYNDSLKEIEKSIESIESKKSMALNFVYEGLLNNESLKHQFEEYGKDMQKLIDKKEKMIKQINLLNENIFDKDKMRKIIYDELSYGLIEDFIRKFLSEIIVSKIDDNRYNIKLNIFLDLMAKEQTKSKGILHSNGKLDDEIIFLKDQHFENNKSKNKYTYNVYISN